MYIQHVACQEFDFNELESSTEYDGGFSRQTPCVGWYDIPFVLFLEWRSNIDFHRFWEAVHSMALEDKRKLLQFTTGRFVFKPHIFVATFDPRAF